MAFFEELGKRITDAGQGVAQQTKNLADVTRLNGAISEKEKQISQLIFSIGQDYYMRHKEDSDSEEQQFIEQINALYAEIAKHQEEILLVKGFVKCPSCGADVSVQASFCNSCGTKVERMEIVEAAGAETKTCPSCGATVGAENNFCNQCGAKLSE